MDPHLLEEGLALVAEARADLVGVVVGDDESTDMSSDSGAIEDGDGELEEFLTGGVRAEVQQRDSDSSSDASTESPEEEELSDMDWNPSDYLVNQKDRKNLRGFRSDDGMRVRKEATLSQKQWIIKEAYRITEATPPHSYCGRQCGGATHCE